MTKLGIFIFRRDCRLYDNLGLIELSKQVDQILPLFILDSNQIVRSKKNSHYFSSNAVQFICESLEDLDQELKSSYGSKLFLLYGTPWEVIAQLLTRLNKFHEEIVLGFNIDFSSYAEKRDHAIERVCSHLDIPVIKSSDDYTLLPIDQLKKSDGTGFKQFGAFYSSTSQVQPSKPTKLPSKIKFVGSGFESKLFKQLKPTYPISNLDKFYEPNEFLAQHGGRAEGLKRLGQIKKFTKYNTDRDMLAYSTTGLSAALNMGCLSIREVYWRIKEKLGLKSQLIKQLYWRDFYLAAIIYLPEARSFSHVMDERYEKIQWPSNSSVKKNWVAMINGQTGFLLIDAGINEMKTTGFLHNRLRMILGVFWTKYLHIHILNPKYGSQAGYSSMLVDAIGPSQNKMNHHWILDFDYPGKKFSAPNAPLSGRPMRIDNSMIKTWDPDCVYIKKWLPHLESVPNKVLYKWDGSYSSVHPGPIFDPKAQYAEWIKLCKGIK